MVRYRGSLSVVEPHQCAGAPLQYRIHRERLLGFIFTYRVVNSKKRVINSCEIHAPVDRVGRDKFMHAYYEQ